MSRSLSVLLPVKNAQATLNTAVHQILDEMTDSGDRFEILIIDDGSTDATSEVAHDLTCHYPQIRLLRHGISRGREAAIRTGLERSRGEVIMLRDDPTGFSIIDRPAKAPNHIPSRPARPNFLNRAKNFALGE